MTGMPPPAPGGRKKPCSQPLSHPPKRRNPAYDHRPGAGPGRPHQRARPRAADHQRVRVILPDEPPRLTPGAARALLRILLKARARATERGREECP